MQEGLEDRNRASLVRLRAVADRLSDQELARVIDPPWTAAALFAHIAFWDRFVLVRWPQALETGAQVPLSVDDDAMELVNGAALPQWGLIPPPDAVAECLKAAGTVNELVASLGEERLETLLALGRRRLVDRSLHRDEHLVTLEAAFPPPV